MLSHLYAVHSMQQWKCSVSRLLNHSLYDWCNTEKQKRNFSVWGGTWLRSCLTVLRLPAPSRFFCNISCASCNSAFVRRKSRRSVCSTSVRKSHDINSKHQPTKTSLDLNPSARHSVVILRESESQQRGRGFESRPFIFHVDSGQDAYTHASVIKHCHLVLAKGRWRSRARKVTAGLVESDSIIPPGLWQCHLWPDCLKTATMSSSNAYSEYGTIFTRDIFVVHSRVSIYSHVR